jgi:hypothetical protein
VYPPFVSVRRLPMNLSLHQSRHSCQVENWQGWIRTLRSNSEMIRRTLPILERPVRRVERAGGVQIPGVLTAGDEAGDPAVSVGAVGGHYEAPGGRQSDLGVDDGPRLLLAAELARGPYRLFNDVVALRCLSTPWGDQPELANSPPGL